MTYKEFEVQIALGLMTDKLLHLLSRSEDTCPHILHAMAEHPQKYYRRSDQHALWVILRKIAANKNTSHVTLEMLSRNRGPRSVDTDLMRNPNTPAEAYCNLVQYETETVRIQIAERPNMHPMVLVIAAKDKQASVRYAALNNPNMPKPPPKPPNAYYKKITEEWGIRAWFNKLKRSLR